MTHLGERITDFVFGELPAREMVEAKRHVVECEECRLEVEQWERTHSFLKTSADIEPPRPIIFEVEKPRFSWNWNWLMPAAAAAALLVAGFIAAPIQVQWQRSQLTIVFGKPSPGSVSAPASLSAAVQQQPPAFPAAQPVAENVDYQKIEGLLNAKLQEHDSVEKGRIQQLQGELKYLESMEHQTEQENVVTAVNLQELAQQRGGSKD